MRKAYGLLFLLLVSCVSRDRVSETSKSLIEIRKSITATTGESRTVSTNGRVYTSQYFSPSLDPNFDPEQSEVRAYAVITILGDSRPYDITVDGYIQKKTKTGYGRAYRDFSLSKRLLSDFTRELARSRGKGNVVDDFRPF